MAAAAYLVVTVSFGCRALEEFRNINKGAINWGQLDPQTSVLLAVQGRVLVILGINDTVKSEANLTVFTLKKVGLDMILLTGDSGKTAAAISRYSETYKFNI